MPNPSAGTLPAGLYVVATPIGNLADLSQRAADILRRTDRIAAEDTRSTAALLHHLGLADAGTRQRLLAVHQHNETQAAGRIVAMIARGESVALVSDAGTPALSDPGAHVVRAVHAAALPVWPIPGASALTAMLSVSGLVSGAFVFEGFLPSGGAARRGAIDRIVAAARASVVFEAPHRIRELLTELQQSIDGERDLAIGRELTKRFEQVWLGRVGQALDWLGADANRERGEFVVVIGAAPAGTADEDDRRRQLAPILKLLLAELSPSRAAAVAAKLTGLPRKLCYEQALAQAAPDDA